ncbi:unnamed protein product [Cuscuta epithymum]|uniref:F-box associated domain-containing protein n=1 Tax=Cuscuta epithymum TaxID=186058 RepID=A0AAV0DKS2_9ASTE|nr:unnamed protein product [Cuscuta epithymum]
MQDYGNADTWTRLYHIEFTYHEEWPIPSVDAFNTWKNVGVSSGTHPLIYYMDDVKYGDDTFYYVTECVDSLVLLGNKDTVADVHLLEAIAGSGCMEEENAGGRQEI